MKYLKRATSIGFVLAFASIAIAPAPIIAQTADLTFPVRVDGTPAGAATIAANLPTDAVVLRQKIYPALPSKQVESEQQANIVLTTTDAALISTMTAWLNANNSGAKNTVQRKSVEIDRVEPSKPTLRFELKGAWPTKIETSGAATLITVVYQSLEPVP
ncbi:MAG: phage tail protein [Gemmatimonadota bacterium]|nr:phage tail protein [Gemmatimonadota bacterium]